MEILISEKEIKKIVKGLANKINNDYQGKSLVIVGILKGSIIFMADLIRELNVPVEIDFVQLSSYQGTETTGQISLLKDLTTDIISRDVLIVEDIIDTGLTLNWLKQNLLKRSPKSLKVVTLLDKPSRRKVEFLADYIGRVIPDKFVVGYGLDCDEKFRQLPFIGFHKL